MKYSLFLLATLLFGNSAICQVHLDPKVIASSGQYVHQGPLEVSYTVGEMSAVTMLGSMSGLHLTQGFHQPEEVAILTALNEQKPDEINFALYPNPTAQTVWLGYKLSDRGKVNIGVYSLDGKLVQTLFSGDYTGTTILDHYDVSRYPAGNYVLSLQLTTSAGIQSQSSKQFSVTH